LCFGEKKGKVIREKKNIHINKECREFNVIGLVITCDSEQLGVGLPQLDKDLF
jgi:hypothetical protein